MPQDFGDAFFGSALGSGTPSGRRPSIMGRSSNDPIERRLGMSDVFLLTDGNKEGRVAVFSLTTNKWELVTPVGDGCPPSDYGAGKYWAQPKGYFDPRLNVLVVHGGMTERVWVYRHGRH